MPKIMQIWAELCCLHKNIRLSVISHPGTTSLPLHKNIRWSHDMLIGLLIGFYQFADQILSVYWSDMIKNMQTPGKSLQVCFDRTLPDHDSREADSQVSAGTW